MFKCVCVCVCFVIDVVFEYECATRASYPFVMDDVFVFAGHTCGPFPCLFVETVFFGGSRLRFQLSTLKHTHKKLVNAATHICRNHRFEIRAVIVNS